MAKLAPETPPRCVPHGVGMREERHACWWGRDRGRPWSLGEWLDRRGRGGGPGRGRSGQAATELAISSVVLLLIATGLLDLGRVFYFQVAMYDGVWEGGRHAAWYSPSLDSNPYLDDADILSAVNQSLNSRGLTAQFPSGTSSTCPTTSSTFKDPPYAASYYPSATQLNTPYLYICYKKPGGSYFGGMATAPANDR